MGPPEVAGTGKEGTEKMWMLKILAACAALVVSAVAYAAEPLPPFGDLPDIEPVVTEIDGGLRCVRTPLITNSTKIKAAYTLELVEVESLTTLASAVYINGIPRQADNGELLAQKCAGAKAAS